MQNKYSIINAKNKDLSEHIFKTNMKNWQYCIHIWKSKIETYHTYYLRFHINNLVLLGDFNKFSLMIIIFKSIFSSSILQ